MRQLIPPLRVRFLSYLLLVLGLSTGLFTMAYGIGLAQEVPDIPQAGLESSQSGSPIHPTIPLLDDQGENVLESGEPVSTVKTCGACHDTQFITNHSFHADAGLGSFGDPGSADTGRAWDTSTGLFGKWDPLRYRYLSPEGDQRLDLTTPEWVQLFGARHVGGGPAETGRDGQPLADLAPGRGPETQIIDPETGQPQAWDWQESGTVEMNCFLCHTPDPDNQSRIQALQDGQFAWANTATLTSSGVVEALDGGWRWVESAFTEDGELSAATLNIREPSDQNCAQCHGLVHVDAQTPLVLEGCSSQQWSTITTGQIYSPQVMSNSGMNLSGKSELDRSFDVHAERVLKCTDCHYSLNNPIYYREADDSRPDHLEFDPRRIDLGEYLFRPSHQFAKGQSVQGLLAPELDNTLRRCDSCHNTNQVHDWLPYQERHMEMLSCETCHIPKMYAPARQSMDWTVLRVDGTPASSCRGVELDGQEDGQGQGVMSTTLVTGFRPVLLPRDNGDGSLSLAPFNLITSWYWLYGEPQRPVPLRDLQAAWLADDGNYHPEILATFDADGDGQLNRDELVIDNNEKTELIAARLSALGLDNPRIAAQVQPYSINHNVTHGEWATKECSSCHGEDSLVTLPILLSDRTPGGVLPVFLAGEGVSASGSMYTGSDGSLYYQPGTDIETDAALSNLYILGHNSVAWIDWGGAIIFLGVLAGVSLHGGLRYIAARRQKPGDPELQEVYMYSVYERLWHWLQTVVIFGLIFTGLVIHRPDQFGIFSFRFVVEVHNILAFLLLANAALAAFYHLASGEIRQFLPQPQGFINDAIQQAKFYLQGIFKGERHPFEKTRQRKLNPLQQVTYLGLLNVLLPLQVITGALMWGVQRWPGVALRLGGLPFLAPLHTLVAWLFASFIVMHVYLTTTGYTPMAGIKSMIMGWDELEVHPVTLQEGEAQS